MTAGMELHSVPVMFPIGVYLMIVPPPLRIHQPSVVPRGGPQKTLPHPSVAVDRSRLAQAPSRQPQLL